MNAKPRATRPTGPKAPTYPDYQGKGALKYHQQRNKPPTDRVTGVHGFTRAEKRRQKRLAA